MNRYTQCYVLLMCLTNKYCRNMLLPPKISNLQR